MVPKPSEPKLDYRIKLLSGNNVVMVEANGLESEIFTPHILNGRITFLNIIPNRRCCFSAATAGTKSVLPSMDRKPLVATNNTRAWRVKSGQDKTVMAPLAYSTPSRSMPPIAYSYPSVPMADKENIHRLEQRSGISYIPVMPTPDNELGHRLEHRSGMTYLPALPTPEEVRRAQATEVEYHVPTPYEVVKDTLVRIPSGVKVMRLYRNQTPNTPKRIGRVVGLHTNTPTKKSSHAHGLEPPYAEINGNTHAGMTDSEFRMPSTPELLLARRKNTVRNPTESSLQKQITPASIAKWRKCITPVRTYSRRLIQNHASLGSVKKSLNNSAARIRARLSNTDGNSKVLPNFLVNPTKSVRPNLKVEVKKRKCVIDPKISISPRSFKKQQIDSSDLKQDTNYRLPSNRKLYDASKHSAFELLTNSNRVRTMSSKLNNQFRKGCINKASSTNPKYKLLCTLPPLEKPKEKPTSVQATQFDGGAMSQGDNKKITSSERTEKQRQ